jgi:hypothetical protein
MVEKLTILKPEEGIELDRGAKDTQMSQVEPRKRVFVIDPPVSFDDGEYFLFVHRHSPFGGSASTIFVVDRLVTVSDRTGRAVAIQGIRVSGTEEIVVTEFPLGTSYLLAHKSKVRALSAKEMKEEQQAEQEDFMIMGEGGSMPGMPEAANGDKPIGQYL